MGHLDRYKKPGGFIQLLTLLESFARAKQEKFLTLIEEENPIWAKMLKEKLLTVERITAWPPLTLAEIIPRMNLNIFVIALSGLKPEQVERFLGGLSAAEKRRVTSELETVKPQPNEIQTTHVKLVEAVRKMVVAGELRLEAIDPAVLVNEKTEEALLQSATYVKGESKENQSHADPSHDEPTIDLVKEALKEIQSRDGKGSSEQKAHQASLDLKAVQALMLNLQKENKALKTEIKVLKDKLDTIRKIA